MVSPAAYFLDTNGEWIRCLSNRAKWAEPVPFLPMLVDYIDRVTGLKWNLARGPYGFCSCVELAQLIVRGTIGIAFQDGKRRHDQLVLISRQTLVNGTT